MKAFGSIINIVNCILKQVNDIQTFALPVWKPCSFCISHHYWHNYRCLDMVHYTEWQEYYLFLRLHTNVTPVQRYTAAV